MEHSPLFHQSLELRFKLKINCPKIIKFLLFYFIVFQINVSAQEIQGPYFVYYVIKNSSLSKTYSGYCQKNKVLQNSSIHGAFSMSGSKCEPTIYYTPNHNFIGRDTVTYEYKDYYTGKIRYWSFVFIVAESYIELRPDIYVVNQNAGDLDVYPLVNDSSSLGSYRSLKIHSITESNHLVVIKPNDSTICFKPESGFTGLAYISYTVYDLFDTKADGVIIVNVVDSKNLKNDSLYLSTPKSTNLSIPLPLAGYIVKLNPKKGYLDFNNDFSVVYRPQSGITGLDTFVLVNNKVYKSVFISICNVNTPNKLTVDDVIYTPKDTDVTFNVGVNDITRKYPFLLDKGQARGVLKKLDNLGNFNYTPESGFEGIESFTYKVCPLGQCEYGKAKIVVGNWQPDNTNTYKFSTPKNVPIVLNYRIPLRDYTFSSSEDSLKFYPGYQTIVTHDSKNCPDTISGFNLLIFYPPRDYIGNKSFKVNYCIPSTNECNLALCEIAIYDESKSCLRQCVGDCVWPGDINLDGEVNMQDFLQIGYNFGYKGESRSYNSPNIFRALKSNNWDASIQGSMTNMKNADTDGNGIVDYADTANVSAFYKQQHSFVAKPVYDKADFPLILNVLTPNVDSGDIAYIEISFGNDSLPAINISGYSYTLDYYPEAIYEPSLGIQFYDQSWVTLNAATMHMYKKPWVGRLESGCVRSNGQKVSGKGAVEALSFIVNTDSNIFFRNKYNLDVPFYFHDILIMDENGLYSMIPDQKFFLHLSKKADSSFNFNSSDLVVFPNPIMDQFTIHLNGENKMQSINLYDLEGHLLKQIKQPDSKQQIVDLQDLKNGLYLLKVETSLGFVSKKVEILR